MAQGLEPGAWGRAKDLRAPLIVSSLQVLPQAPGSSLDVHIGEFP